MKNNGAKRSIFFLIQPHFAFLQRTLRVQYYVAMGLGGSACAENGAEMQNGAGVMKNNRAKRNRNIHQGGFSLVEMLVAVALFAVVMVISTSSLLALVDANRKAQALQSVMNNLNTAVDGMVRSIRMGSNYHCGNVGLYTDPRSCAGDALLAFEPFGGNTGSGADQWVYWFDGATLYKSVNGGSTRFALTAPEVRIDEVKFYVLGAGAGDQAQPKVVITMRGTAGIEKIKTQTTFNIQATATQRALDL